MATTVFNASAASNLQATVLTSGGSATNNVSPSRVNPVQGGVTVTSSHLGVARPQSGGLLAVDSLITVSDIATGTNMEDHNNIFRREVTTGLDESALAANNFVIRYDGQIVDSTDAVYKAGTVSAITSTTVNYNAPSDSSMISSFSGSVPAVNAY